MAERGAVEPGVLVEVLSRSYGMDVSTLTDGPAGTRTRNHLATDREGHRWFVKTYPPGTDLDEERRALELSEYARHGGIPAPAVRRSLVGEPLVSTARLALSVTTFVAGARTAEGGLRDQLWAAVGDLVGRLHRVLAEHPTGKPRTGSTDEVCTIGQATRRLERLVSHTARPIDSPFASWALATARQRRQDLASVRELLGGLPRTLTMQAIHGDLASTNLLINDDGIAALIDFRPPASQSPAWELGRIVLDPRTVLADPDWISGLASAVGAYRTANPALPVEDLIAVPRLAAGYLSCSAYPLSVALESPADATPELYAYARARHDATRVLTARVDEAERALHDLLR